MKRPVATIALLSLLVAGYAMEFAVAVIDYARDTGAGVIEAALVSLSKEPVDVYVRLGAITPTLIQNGEWWRLIMAVFLHGGVLHLAFNAWALLQFGILLEKLAGGPVLLATYVASGLVASAASAAWIVHGCALGASGAIFGIVGGLVALIGSRAPGARWTRAVSIQIVAWAIASIAIGVASPAIDNAAHIGGFSAGLVAGTMIRLVRVALQRPERRLS